MFSSLPLLFSATFLLIGDVRPCSSAAPRRRPSASRQKKSATSPAGPPSSPEAVGPILVLSRYLLSTVVFLPVNFCRGSSSAAAFFSLPDDLEPAAFPSRPISSQRLRLACARPPAFSRCCLWALWAGMGRSNWPATRLWWGCRWIRSDRLRFTDCTAPSVGATTEDLVPLALLASCFVSHHPTLSQPGGVVLF